MMKNKPSHQQEDSQRHKSPPETPQHSTPQLEENNDVNALYLENDNLGLNIDTQA